MVFSSHIFLFVFLPLALAGYYLLPRRARNAFLTAVSYVFYGWSNPAFGLLMLLSTLIDYVAGLLISGQWRPAAWRRPVEMLTPGGPRTRLQRLGVTLSVLSNLALLGFFKYFNFLVDSWNGLAAALGRPGAAIETSLRVVLPLGISFYTFQSMSYSIDVYRGHARAIRNFVDFACYVAMFPQLVAGPIIRFAEVARQLTARRESVEKFARGSAFFALGLAKKVLLANPCGKIADLVFDSAGGAGALDAWYGVTAYAFQIYFDFSGYSDMAIGLGLMFGFVFAKNFDSPYRSASITEFWRRWHISLSSWLRDYLYVPLGGNRRGPMRTAVNLAIVMLLGGLWHGAAWTFVLWGAYHGAWLILERALGRRPLYHRLPTPLRVALTFVIVLGSWVLFRSPDLSAAFAMFRAMAGVTPTWPAAGAIGGLIYAPLHAGTWAAAALVTWLAPSTWDWTRRLPAWKLIVALGLALASIAVLSTQAYNPFIYFIF
ncbi:MAG: MBOAT family protein [Kiritimatiellae bacterium]|nr:MBOAT family protein [Kiritimatiellia bacterium]